MRRSGYGAAIEIRQNFAPQVSNNGSSGASGSSSLETMFVRRAFTYVASDHVGIVRAGQAEGIISLFDNGVTTFQFLPTNNLQNGDDFAALTPTNATMPFFFLSGAGNEYGYAKMVYLSPQVAGVDFGLQYAPNTSNGEGISSANVNLNNVLSGAGSAPAIRAQLRTAGVRRCHPVPASSTDRASSTRLPSGRVIRARSMGSGCWPTPCMRSVVTRTILEASPPSRTAIRSPAASITVSTTG